MKTSLGMIEKFARDLAAKAESFVDDISTLEGRTFSMASTQIGSLAEGSWIWQIRSWRTTAVTCLYQDRLRLADTTVCLPVDANDQIDRSVCGYASLWSAKRCRRARRYSGRWEMR